MKIDKNNLISGSGGGKGGGSTGATESPNDLTSTQYAQIVDLLCEGEIEGFVNGEQSIYIDGTPLRNPDGTYNFQGVIVDWRTGTQAQTPLIGNDSVRSEVSVGILILKDTPVVRQITDAGLNSVNVTISTPRMTVQDTKTGDITGSSVQYTIEVQSNGGGFVLKDTVAITGKTISNYKKSTNVILDGIPPWDIKVTRITEDAPNSATNNDIYFSSYTKIIDTKLSYPNSTLVGIRIDAKQFNSIPSRGYEVKLLKIKIPLNYDPLTRIYTGIWDGTFKVAWSDNPAWCFYDLITNDRYGLGKFIDTSLTDKWALYEIGQYCDEDVPSGFLDELSVPILEPRFTCNIYIQKRNEAYRVIRDMASIFRSMIFWSSNGVSVVQDKPEQVFSQFTNASVINGAFNYEGSSARVRHTTAIITWNDPNDAYKQKLEYVEDVDGIAKFGINELQTVSIGCTSRGQAHRLGKWLLYSENTETEVVSFKIGLEGTQISPGVIIRTIDSHRAGARYGGRIKSVSGTVVTLDSKIVLESGVDYTISFVDPDGSVVDKTITTTKPADTDIIDIDSVFTTDPIVNSVWVVSSLSLSPEEWRVLNVKEENDGTYLISALEYNSNKYDFTELGLFLEEKNSTLWNNTAEQVISISYIESLYKIGYRSYGTKIHITWESDPSSVRFQLRWRRGFDNYKFVQINGNDLELSDVGFGSFDFQVIAYNALGVPSPPLELLNQNIVGITAPPENVSNFALTIIDGIGEFSWDFITDLDADLYEIRKGTIWDNGESIGNTDLDNFSISNMSLGINDYMIKAIDLSGNYSVIESSVSVTITAHTISSIDYIFGNKDITFSWSSSGGTFSVSSYEIRENGTDWDSATPLTIIEGTEYSEQVSWTVRTIRIKSIDSVGYESSNHSVAVVNITNPTILNLSLDQSSDLASIKWESAKGSLAISGYEIRYDGVDWDSAVLDTTIEGTSYQKNIDWNSRIYRVRAIDTNGNLSNELTVTSTITNPIISFITESITGDILNIDWVSVKGTLTISGYVIRYDGSSWITASDVLTTKTNQHTEQVSWNSRLYRVRAIDINGNLSNELTITSAITNPLISTISAEITGDIININWISTHGSLSIAGYIIKYDGVDWNTAIDASTIEDTSYQRSVSWSNRTYRVRAIDINGNLSNELTIVSTVSSPVLSNILIEHNNNSVVVKWELTKGSLSIKGYLIKYDGIDWNNAIYVGIIEGTVYQTLVSWDSRLYRVRAIDINGNLSNELTTTSSITAPLVPVISSVFTSDKLTLEFTSVTGTLSIESYEIREGGTDWDTANLVLVTTGTSYIEPIDNTFTTKTFRIKAKDASDKYSIEAIEIISVVSPTVPIITESYDKKTLMLSWVSTAGTFVISHYEVRAGGTTWANSPLLGIFDVSALSILVEWSSRTFFVKAIDEAGFVSTEGSKTINITNPQIGNATAQIVDNNVLLKWNVDLGTLPSDGIELSKGDDYESSAIIGKKTGTFTIIFESIGGLFKYWLTPIDSAGNKGVPYSIAAFVSAPPDYVLNQKWISDFSGEKINALINGRTHIQSGFETSEIDDWADYSAGKATISSSTDFYSGTNSALVSYTGTVEPTSTGNTNVVALEIPEYIAVHRNSNQNIRITVRAKKPSSSSSAQFAISYSTNGAGSSGWRYFTPTLSWQTFEFTYNVPAGSGTDFIGILGDTSWSGLGVLIDELTISIDGNDGEFSNTGSLLAPVKLDDTFAEHFDNNIWTTIDAQLAANYPFYLQPTPNPASYIEIFDYGQILSKTKVSVVLNSTILAGSPLTAVTISLSPDNITYIDYVGVTDVIDNNFRYVKITLDITQSASDKGLLKIDSMEVILDTKLSNDAGTATAISTDSGGTTITFNREFLDIESIVVTPLGIIPITPAVNFVDVPNPTDFKVLLFDSNGDRYTGNFTWSARGY